MNVKSLLVVGAGGHGRSVADCALASTQWDVVDFADDQYGRSNHVNGLKVVCKFHDFLRVAGQYDGIIIAIGNNKVRSTLIEEALQHELPLVAVIHPSAIVSPHAKIGVGSTIMAGCVVGPNAVIGRGCIVNTMSCVDHDVRLNDYAHLGVGVKLAGGVEVGVGAFLQAAACAGHQVVIENWSVISPGTALMVDKRLYAAGGSGGLVTHGQSIAKR